MPGIFSVYIISKSGGLIFNHDVEHNFVSNEVEKTFSYPLDIKLDFIHKRICVTFGQRDGIKVGYALLAINGEAVDGRKIGDKDVIDDILANEDNYPINIKFGVPRLITNEKIVMASTFHSLYAIAATSIQIGPKKEDKPKSSGIGLLETENFRLNCFQTLTGVKFLVLSDLSTPSNKDSLLKKIYELYTDFVLKNPFYSLDMPIRCELFESNLQLILEQNEKTGTFNNV